MAKYKRQTQQIKSHPFLKHGTLFGTPDTQKCREPIKNLRAFSLTSPTLDL